MSPGERTAIYRFYDTNDALLYVGITADLEVRWDNHSRKKPWWPLVARRHVVWRDSRNEALADESRAISEEKPLYNVMGSDNPPPLGSPERPGTTAPAAGLTAEDARRQFADLLNRVGFQGEQILITRHGKPIAKLVPVTGDETVTTEQ
ncbi:type II toxin-antitoxin system prevent-host-death family antitoxin [Streptomyces sp. NPDC005407]|uniref:type II toxin-antitoxin system prevent-host-death family antitoxin n=1 Tax=Streptomyces sp. NPDC005407 TaxID=3155340 RepID=UPI0033B80551